MNKKTLIIAAAIGTGTVALIKSGVTYINNYYDDVDFYINSVRIYTKIIDALNRRDTSSKFRDEIKQFTEDKENSLKKLEKLRKNKILWSQKCEEAYKSVCEIN